MENKIETKELRRGNFIYFPNAPIPKTGVRLPTFIATVEEISDITVARYVQINLNEREKIKELINDCAPIPLTEQWLVNFGFEITPYNGGKSYLLNNFELSKGNNWEYFWYAAGGRNEDGINEPSIDIEFVHQLQNLYFPLEGKELELIKEKV